MVHATEDSIPVSAEQQLPVPASNQQQETSPKSPRITIPLSALSSLAQTTGDASSGSNQQCSIDVQQLQAFLMALQPQISHATSMSGAETIVQTSTYETSGLTNLQNICSVDDSDCGIAENQRQMQNDNAAHTHVMQLQHLAASDCFSGANIEAMNNQMQSQPSTLTQGMQFDKQRQIL